jgi:hypothetical protein
MGFRTIDLDTKEGMEKYKKLKETKSIQETFGKEGIEKFAPRPEEEPKQDTSFMPKYEGKWEAGELPPKQEESVTLEVNIKAPAVLQGVVTGVDQLRVRKQPEGEILYLISKDSIVKILEDHDGWLKVETAPGRQGFVMKSFIKVYSEGG